VIVQSTKDGTLYIFGVCALRRGAGNVEQLWLDRQIAEFETARENQALTSILKGLCSNVPVAVTAFVEELQTWTS